MLVTRTCGQQTLTKACRGVSLRDFVGLVGCSSLVGCQGLSVDLWASAHVCGGDVTIAICIQRSGGGTAVSLYWHLLTKDSLQIHLFVVQYVLYAAH